MTYKRAVCKAEVILVFSTNEEIEWNAEEIAYGILAVEQKLNGVGFTEIEGFPTGAKVGIRIHIGDPLYKGGEGHGKNNSNKNAVG